jgi:single-stranded-DNA-specific exonuclease
MLAPRLNAAGRMGRTELSVELLLTEDSAEAERLTVELNQLNNERRMLEMEIFDEAAAMLPSETPDAPIVLAKRGWYQGVTGIVAARMAEFYLLPVIIISVDDDGLGRGSCRSFGTFRIYDALRSCEDILKDYGGHEMAAGVTITEENIGELRSRVYQYFDKCAGPEPGSVLKLDFCVEKPVLLDVQNVLALERLEPFGNGNPPPCLCIREARLSAMFSIGAGKHTRLKIEKKGRILDCICFSMPASMLGVSEGMLVDVAFEPQINEFRGNTSVQLHVIDIRESPSQ